MPIIGTLPGEEFRLVDGQLSFRTADLHRFLLLDLFSVARSLSGIRGLQPRINNLQTRDGS